ncbi:hypothetical protein ACQEVF_57815 [Nonomuraea polychroma]|uniref:hypothetical protein n=1 Tax=Nonomuraea polychroma TaxID=46176 RepID=UPI003D93D191
MNAANRPQSATHSEHTEHLRAGDRITLDELAVHLSAAAVWLRQLAVAAETPATPLELGENVSAPLDRMADELAKLGDDIARVDDIISNWQPLRPYLHQREPWGTRAHGSDRNTWGKRLSTVLSLRQLLYLAAADQPWLDEEPGIAYLDGIKGVPGLEEWESVRAAKRREAARQAAILAQARQEHCTTCQAIPGVLCRTRNGHLADSMHKPRLAAATAVVDERLAHGLPAHGNETP